VKTSKFILIAWLMAMCLHSIQVASAEDEFRSRFFQSSDGVELHYLEAGVGETLVLVPGWTMPAEIWEHQIRHFAAKYRVVALDPRGQGRSEKVGYGYQPSRRALDIGELLEHIGGGPAVVVGWSIAMQEVLVLMGPTDLRPALDALDRPALFIASSQDWAIDQAELIGAGWPDIQTAVVDKTSHALFVDRPEEFNRILDEFLSGLDSP